MQAVPCDYDQQDLEILTVLKEYSKENLEQAKVNDRTINQLPGSDTIQDDLCLSDTVLVMLAKEIEFVEALTRHKSGFLFNDRKLNIFTETVTAELVPCEYHELWQAIATGTSKRCHNLRKFFVKMLSSKNIMFAKQSFLVYFQCLERIIREDARHTSRQIEEEALKKASRDFAAELYWFMVVESEEGEFLRINDNYLNITLLNRSIHLKELVEFQQCFRQNYSQFKSQLTHLLEVTYYCLAVQYYGIERNYLYEGYYRNTELETIRGNPK